MIPAEQIAVARSMLTPIASRDTKLKRSGEYLIGSCPFHSPDRHPSFAIKGEHWCCYAGCGSGDAISYLMRRRNLSFTEAVAELTSGRASGVVSEARTRPPSPPDRARAASSFAPEDNTAAARRLWEGATSPEIAHFYLHSRGLIRDGELLPAAVRGHHAVYCAETGERLPALVAAVTDGDGAVTAVQRIWVKRRLEYDGSGNGPVDARADLRARKKSFGPLGSGAVRLAPAGRILGLAEGVESALAAQRLFGRPVWATCGAARLHAVALPSQVEAVWVFSDRGDAGRQAAARAHDAYRKQGREVLVIEPSAGYGDFNDQLLGGAR